MKQKIKKLITFLLLLVVGFEYGYSAPSNYNQSPIKDLKYTISGIYASVAPSYEGIGYQPFYYYYSEDHYDVPEVVEIGGNEYTVTSLSRKAFSNYYNSDYKPNYYGSPLKTISLPSTLKTIEDMVFLNCWKLESIVIPENLESFGISVFVGCDALREIFYLPTTAPTNWTATSLTYVPSAEAYNKPTTKINDAQIIPMITFGASSFTYTGNIPSIEWTNNVVGYEAEMDFSGINKEVGTHSVLIPLKLTKGDEIINAKIPFTYTIKGAPLTIKINDATRQYGEENPNFTYSFEGFINNEDESSLSSLPQISTSANKTSNVGTYSITGSGAISSHYDISYTNGFLTIEKAPLTAKVIDSSREYGASNPNFSLEYEGLKNAETTPTWTISPSYTTSATNYSSVGEYEVFATATPKNYELSEIVSGKLIVTPAPLTIQANNISKVYYAENPDLTYSCSGLKNREDKSILSVQPQLATNATKESEVGSYDITISGASAQNYNITYQNGKMTIQKRTLNVTVGNYERDYGEENPDFSIEYDGFVGSDDLSVIDTEPYPYTSATKDTKVGTYSIYITGGSDNNYSFNYNSGKLTINKAEQDIIWNQDLTNLAIGEQVKLLAESTSGLQITYSLDQNSICEIYNAGKATYLDCKAEGEIQIKAYQEGNDNYYSTPRTSKKIIVSSSTEVKPSLTIKQPDLGAISTKVVRGTTYEFTITPEEEWLVHSVSFNGNDYTSKLDKTNTFTTPQITSNSTIIIVYSQSANGIEDISSSNVKIIGTQNGVKVIGAKLGSAVLIYTIDGVLIESEEITSSSQEIKLDNNKLYIIKIGEFTSKVRL